MKLALAPRMSAGAAERALEGRLHETVRGACQKTCEHMRPYPPLSTTDRACVPPQAASMARTSAVRAREALGTCLVEATLDLCQFECDRLERARDAALLQLTKTAAVATEWERRCRDARQEVATASQRAKEQASAGGDWTGWVTMVSTRMQSGTCKAMAAASTRGSVHSQT